MGEMDSLAAPVGEREIATTRIFDAPRELVWKVWTEREHIERCGRGHGPDPRAPGTIPGLGCLRNFSRRVDPGVSRSS
jgi:hypothetical protein